MTSPSPFADSGRPTVGFVLAVGLSLLVLAVTAAPLPPQPAAPDTPTVRLPPSPPTAQPPRPHSPIEAFRRLVAASPAGRQAELASKTPAHREYLERQLAEFDRLIPAEREARLRLLELRFHLLPLLALPAGSRDGSLRLVAPAYRAAVDDRLQAWDALDPETRADLLENRAALDHLLRFPDALTRIDAESADPLSAAQRAQLQRTTARWQAMSAAEREQLAGQLNRFFQFSTAEQERTLGRLATPPSPRLAEWVAELQQLDPEERERCLASLERFANLTPADQERFLRNAVRWARMSPEDRRHWRELQTKLPPLPPPLPPRPPSP